jgi:Tfp pilus assembly protein PilE
MQTDVPANKTRRGLSIAALLLGLIGLLELGWAWMENIKASPCGKPLTEHYFSIPSLLGFMLGLTAIIKNNLNTSVSSGGGVRAAIRTGGKRLAILGVIASAPGMLITIASLPSCSNFLSHPCREIAPIQILRTIHNSQEQYFATRSRYATLEELAASEMIDTAQANGSPVYGYVYSSSDTTAKTYCVHADRANDKCGSRDFIVCEDGIIRFVESKNKGSVRRGEGQPIGAPH